MSTDEPIAAFIRARLDEREKALRDLASRRAADALPAIEMQMHHAVQIATSFPRHGMSHLEYEAWQELCRGVEAKRRTLDKLLAWEHDYSGPYPCSRDGAVCECGLRDKQLDVVRALATEWSTHPDYRSQCPL